MVLWTRRRYSKEAFINAWQESSTIRQVALRLNLYPTGDAYNVLKRAAKELGLPEFSQRSGLNTIRNRNQNSRIPLSSILVENSDYTNSNLLKKRLISEGLLAYLCALCGLAEWRETPLVLQMDHVNGRRQDNRLENLRLLCPNCHSQTHTFSGKNKGH